MIKLIKEKFFQEDSKMKTSKRVLSVLLVVLMLLTSAPLGGVTDWFSNRASAATNANAKAVVDNICGTVGYRPGVDNYNDCYAYVSAFCKKMYGSAPGGVSGYTLTRPGSFYLVGQAAGTGVTAASLSSVLSQAMPGDVVQMYWDYGTGHGQHTAIVYSADSSAFTILQDGASFSAIKKSTYNYSSNYTRWRGSGYGISLYRHSNYNNLFGGSSSNESLKTPTISFNKSSYNVGEQVTFSWTASPSSVLSHYWVIVDLPGGSSWISTRIDKSVTSYSFTPDREGSYYVYVAATPYGSQSGEGSLEDRKNISVTSSFFSFDVNTYVDDVAYNSGHTNVTFDVYINGACVANDVIDYYQSFAKGTTYLVNDIKTSGGYVLTGNTSFSGVINSNTSITPRVKSHTHFYTSKITKAATCTTQGEKTFTCSCGNTYTETLAKKAHSFTSKKVTSTYLKSNATCTNPAVYFYKCANCPEKGTETFTNGSILEHNFVIKDTSPAYLKSEATDSVPAIYFYKCETCSNHGTEVYTHTESVDSTGKKITELKKGDVIEFGYYPQSKVTDSALISILNSQPGTWKSYDYDTGKESDFMQYKDVVYNGENYRAVLFSSYRPIYRLSGHTAKMSYQDNNGYYPNTVYWFSYDPLTWVVITPSNGKVICSSVIDSQAFYPDYSKRRIVEKNLDVYPNNWEYSTIRTWLNKTFYNTAFTLEQQAMINKAKLNNAPFDENEWGAKFNGDPTIDKIFLLNETTVNYGIVPCSEYAKSQGLYCYQTLWGTSLSPWMLRTPSVSDSGDRVRAVVHNDDYGSVVGTKDCVETSNGVRPVFYISTKSTIKSSHAFTRKVNADDYLKSAATCTSPAVYYYCCATCAKKGTATFTYGSALGHTGGTANCVDQAICTRCNTAYGSVDTNNHKSVVKDSAVAPTCITPGKTCGSHCSVCNKVIIDQNVIPANGHTESGWLINTDGTKHIECTVCHAVLRTETTEECDHSEKRSEYIVTPTCTQPGKLVYICDLCDEQLGEEDVEPLGHSYDIETVTKATLSKNGAVVQTCFDCDAKKTVRTIYYPKTFAVAAQVYTGKALKPSVIVKDSAGKTISSANYIVTYANNVAIGTATAKVTFRGNYSGTKTLIFAIVPAQVSKPKATQTTSTVTLSWSKVAGSNMRYYVFSYNPGTKKYTCLSYTTGTSYTVKKLSSGTTYYFAVQAYNTTAKKWGKVSSVLTTATKPGTPTLKAVAGTRKATLSWTKQNGATGYLLYMATSKNGKYTKIATLKGNTKVSYTKMGLTKGRYYYFKVIAYKTVGSTNIYGAYSSVKYVKVK